MTETRADILSRYCADLGWYLVAIPAGSKAPRQGGWQLPERAITTPEAAHEYWTRNPDHNAGLLHHASGTVALDIDNVEWTRIAFDGIGLDYDDIMSKAPRIVGRPTRAKALFKAPTGIDLSRRSIAWPTPEPVCHSCGCIQKPASMKCADCGAKMSATETVFEFRAGAVQDVLPPSIHPDTGNPYTWAGPSIWDGLPDLPAPILTIWREWDRFAPQFRSLCPWKPEDEFRPPSKTRPAGDRTSVIDSFNAANDIHELLSRYGYKRCGRNRYLSPNSKTKLAGVVVFDDDRAYSHHASDPFDSAHTFDAFDLFCQYEHGGDVSKAVKDAGAFLGVVADHSVPEYDAEAIAHGKTVADAILPSRQKAKAPQAKGGIPEHLTSIPGTLQDAVNLFSSTAVADQPQFAVLAALVLGSTVMGRRWCTADNNYSSMYYVAIGPTGSGKEYIRKFVMRVLDDCGLSILIGPNGYTSGSGVMSTLISKPNHVVFIDELGRKLKQAAGRDNSNAQSMLTALMEIFGSQDGIVLPQGYSKAGLNKQQADELDKVVRKPSITMVGMSNGNDFTEAIGYGDVASGFLNRMLIVETDIGIPMPRRVRPMAVGDRLKEWCEETASATSATDMVGATDSHDIPPAPVIIEWADDAIPIYDQITRDITSYRNQNASNPLSDMKSRTRELIFRVALIVARSCREERISAASLEWARDYVTLYTDRVIAMLSEKMAINDFHAICNKTISRIKKSASKGMTQPEICEAVPPFRAMKIRDREEVMRVLIEDYGVIKINRNEGKRGRPSFAWIYPPDAE